MPVWGVTNRARTESGSLCFGVDSGALQKGNNRSWEYIFFSGKKPPQIWQDKPILVRSTTQGKKAIAGFLMVAEAWMKSCKGQKEQMVTASAKTLVTGK